MTVKEWCAQEQGKHFCHCGCGQEIIIKPRHKQLNRGIPKFISSHNVYTEEFKKNNTIIHTGKKISEEHKIKISNGNKGKILSEETRKKISILNTGKKRSEEVKKGMSERQTGKILSEETKRKIGRKGEDNKNYGRKISEEQRQNMSKARVGYKHTKEAKKNMSKAQSGKNNAAWLGGISFGKYCSKFNNKCKEQNRNKFNNQCFLCGKPQNDLKNKLAVHHIDYNKQQGCNNKKWSLVPLCSSCHSKTNFDRDYYQDLILNLLKIRKIIFDYESKIDYRSF